MMKVALLVAVLALAAGVLAQNKVPGTHWGYINVNQAHNASLFYWMFEAETDPSNAPLILWLTGGPGCSAELALFFENGPFTINDDLSLKANPYSWTKAANMLWVDSPIGTGFSYTHDNFYVRNESQVAEDLNTMLEAFMVKYPKYQKLPFFVTGESYGGHYVSAVSERVSRNPKINFKGLAIGNGWVNPQIQYQHYVDQALYGEIITQAQADQVNALVPACVNLIKHKQWSDAFAQCSQIVGTILQFAGNINPYNMKQPCTYPGLCYDMAPIQNYLDQPWVQQQLGVTIPWQPCTAAVYGPLESDWSHSFVSDVAKVLERGYRAFVYEGVLDLMCGFTGTTEYLNSMVWSGQHAFMASKNVTWNTGPKVSGTLRTAAGHQPGSMLTYINVYDAGHMVPHDQPAAALNILQHLISGKPF